MFRQVLAAAALLCVLTPVSAATKGDDPARPRDPTANQPSESGAQTTTPKGAVTGAGQPQGAAQPAEAQTGGGAKAKADTSDKRKTKKVTKKKRKKKVS